MKSPKGAIIPTKMQPLAYFLYRITTSLYFMAIRIAAFFTPKARHWVQGQFQVWDDLSTIPAQRIFTCWFHCASVGEYEQGRPIIEKIRLENPNWYLVVTFFSSSGYTQKKNDNLANLFTYLPADSPQNAVRFIQQLKPNIVFFIKYEFWFHYLQTIANRQIPLFLLSAIFRIDQPFFKPYGQLHRRMLSFFTQIFVQDQNSQKLLSSIHISSLVLNDLRFDRVIQVADKGEIPPSLKNWIQGHQIFVAGSTWPKDEHYLFSLFKSPGFDVRWKMMLVPHELNQQHLQELMSMWKEDAVLLSNAINNPAARVLIVDQMGILKNLYRCASIVFIGGGFGRGIHNTLEAAVYGKPIVIGPNYKKFLEAVQLIQLNSAFSIKNDAELIQIFNYLNENEDIRSSAGKKAAEYVQLNAGGTNLMYETLKPYLSAKA